MKKIIIALMLIGTLGYTANRITTADMTSTGPDANKFLRSNGVAAPSWEDVPTIISDYIAEIASIAAGEGVRNQDSAANPTAIIGYGESATYSIPADSAMYFNDIANKPLYAFSKAVSSGTSGSVNFLSGVATAGADSGAVSLFSGPVVSGAGNSGAVNIFTGSVGAGTQGDVNISGSNVVLNGNVQMSNYANGYAYFDGSGNITVDNSPVSTVARQINQVAHGLAVGDVIRYNGTAYVEADASADSTAEVYGVVSDVADADNFTVITHGYITGLSGLTSGVAHYLSETAGALTATAPTTTGTVSKPVLLSTSTSAGYVMIQRGFVNGASGGGGGSCYSGANCFTVRTDDSAVCSSNPCSIDQQYSSDGLNNAVTSFGRAATGSYDITIKGGFCNTEPVCVATTANLGFVRYDSGGTTTNVNIDTFNSGGSAADHAGINVSCVCDAP